MYYDNEKNILQRVYDTICINDKFSKSVLLYNNNSFCKKIYKCLIQPEKIQNDYKHDADPPDFFSDELDIMFDVTKVNDSEIKKSYNPTYIAERKMQKEIQSSWIGTKISNVSDKLICIDKDWGSDKIHNIENYQKNMKRVIINHLSSKAHPNKIKDIWLKKHPNITKKGLLIFDETENYFQGTCIPYSSNNWIFKWDNTKPIIFYQPWMDLNIMKPIYESDCDFLIWYAPYKRDGEFTRKTNEFFPYIIILDTWFKRTDYIEYDYSKFTRT